MVIDFLRRFGRRIRAIVGRRALENDMQAELQQHIERATDRLIARGMPPAEARIAARREFGNVTVIEEQARDARGARWVEALSGDVRFAIRYFARHKATVAIIVTVLALGTGTNTLFFSIFQSEFLRPAPAVPRDDAHARIWAQERSTRTAAWDTRAFTLPELKALRERREIFSDVAAWMAEDVIMDGGDSTGSRTVRAQFVTPNYFATLGVPLAAGQGFAQRESVAPDMTGVMSYVAATQLYGNPAGAIGRRILVNEVPVHVVGVAPFRFQGAARNMEEPAVWIPLTARSDISRVSPQWSTEKASLSLFARMAPGASHQQGTALAQQVVTNALPDSAARVGMARTARTLSMTAVPPGDDRQESVIVFTLAAGIGVIILLVAWMNVSSLMVAAAVGRRHEIAVRLSLGASRLRVLRQLVTESTVLAFAGGGGGLLLAWWALTWMMKTEIDGVDLTPDVGTFAFTLALALVSGILFGLSPALHATRGVAGALRDSKAGAGGRSRLQRSFVVVQIMLSQPLLVMLGAMISLIIADYQPHSPAISEHTVAVGFRPLTTAGPGQRPDAVDSLIPRIAARPDVSGAVAEATGFDIRGVVPAERVSGKAVADDALARVTLEGVAPGWFSLVDVPIVLGRDVSLADTAAAEYPVVIGSDLARAFWGETSPIGRVLTSPALAGLMQDSIAMTVVGVYDESQRLPGMTWGGGVARGDKLSRLYTARGRHWRRDRILVRTRGPAESLMPHLQEFIRATAPALPVSSMRTLAQLDAQAYRETLRVSASAGAGGILALLLASLGLYGVVSLAVQQRTREIGIRIAVGAHPARVARMFVTSGVRVSLIALVLGLPLSIVGFDLLQVEGLVMGSEVNIYAIGSVIAVILLAVASLATWVPARRATLVDPMTTLRAD